MVGGGLKSRRSRRPEDEESMAEALRHRGPHGEAQRRVPRSREAIIVGPDSKEKNNWWAQSRATWSAAFARSPHRIQFATTTNGRWAPSVSPRGWRRKWYKICSGEVKVKWPRTTSGNLIILVLPLI